MDNTERLIRLEERVAQQNRLLVGAAAAIAALFGVGSWYVVPRAAAAAVSEEMKGAAHEAVLKQTTEFRDLAREAMTAAESARDQARAHERQLAALVQQNQQLPDDVRMLARTTWAWMRPADEAFAKLVTKGVAPEIESFRNLLGARQNELQQYFKIPDTPLDKNPATQSEFKRPAAK